MKAIYIVVTLLLFACCLTFCDTNYGKPSLSPLTKNQEADSLKIADSIEHLKLIEKASEARTFCKEKKYNTEFCLLINMHVHSGLTRFYVWDFEKNTAIDSGMVSHGCGTNPWGHDQSKTSPQFSNVYESHCSSIGKYKIGDRGYSNWGIHVNYAMHGLDSTNSNSYGRQICMHSWNMIGKVESYPEGTPEGWGCAAVSDEFMKRLDEKLKTATGDVLMWIFI